MGKLFKRREKLPGEGAKPQRVKRGCKKEAEEPPKHEAVIPGFPRSNVTTRNMETSQEGVPTDLILSAEIDIGTREYQQDAFAYTSVEDRFVAIICDGMGGLKGSEQASKSAVNHWIGACRKGIGEFQIFARRAVEEMDRLIRENQKTGGTTAVAVHIQNGSLSWLSVGDSKVYLLRHGRLHALTREHNYQMVLDSRLSRGEITEDEFKKESEKGASLVSYIGRGQLPYMDLSPEPLRLLEDDVVILCSDGLYKSIPESRLERLVASYTGDYEALASYLQDYAAACARRRDNTTVLTIRYRGSK